MKRKGTITTLKKTKSLKRTTDRKKNQLNPLNMKNEKQNRATEIKHERKIGKHGYRMTGCVSHDTINYQREATVNFLRSFN